VSLASYLQEGARATLARQQARLSGKGVTIHAKLVGAPPRRAVIDEAAAHDLIVMGTHGRGGIARLMMGSVAEWVVRNSPVPVLTIGEHGQPAEPKVASEPAP
jgi:nucleotide-binding universal stress UspA family protein